MRGRALGIAKGGSYETEWDFDDRGGPSRGLDRVGGRCKPNSISAGAPGRRANCIQRTVNSGSQRCLRSADFQADRRARAGAVRTSFQEYPGRFSQEGSGLPPAFDHEPGV